MIHIFVPQPSHYAPHRRPSSHSSFLDPFAGFAGYAPSLPLPEYADLPSLLRPASLSLSPDPFDYFPFPRTSSPDIYPLAGPASLLNLNPFFAAPTPTRSQSPAFAASPLINNHHQPYRQPSLHRRNALRRRSEEDRLAELEAQQRADRSEELRQMSVRARAQAEAEARRADAEVQARIAADKREIERARQVEREREAVRKEHQRRLQREVERKRTLVRQALGELLGALAAEEAEPATEGAGRPVTPPKAAERHPKVKFAHPVEQPPAKTPSPAPAASVPVKTPSPAPTVPVPTVPEPSEAPKPAEAPKAASRASDPERAPSPAKDTSLSRLSSISTHLTELIHTFSLPRYLTFTPTSTPSNPVLTYTPHNAPVHAYEQALNKLIADLDGISSSGDDAVRRARREVVKKAEAELRWLEEEVRRVWERENAPPAPESPEPRVDLEGEREGKGEEDEFERTKEALKELLGHDVEEQEEEAVSATRPAPPVEETPAVEPAVEMAPAKVTETPTTAPEPVVPVVVEEAVPIIETAEAPAVVEEVVVVQPGAAELAPVLAEAPVPALPDSVPSAQAQAPAPEPEVPTEPQPTHASVSSQTPAQPRSEAPNVTEHGQDEDEDDDDDSEYEGHDLESVPESDQESDEPSPVPAPAPARMPMPSVKEVAETIEEASQVESFVTGPEKEVVRDEEEEEEGVTLSESDYEMV